MVLKLEPKPVDDDPGDSPRATDSGFVAQLRGVSLWDLVQMECLAGQRKAVRVRCGADLGYLFFEGGQLVHAVQGTLVGDRAVRAVLRWTRGEIAPCDVRWPRTRTVVTPWQTLLMQTAQAQDEDAAGRVGSARGGRGHSGVVAIEAEATDPQATLDSAPDDGPQAPAPVEAEPQPTGPFGPLAFERAVRLDASGDTVAEVGDAEAFAGQAAYAARLGDLLGEMLSLGPLMSMEARCGGQGAASVFVYRDREGGLVALQPKLATDAARIRRDLGI